MTAKEMFEKLGFNELTRIGSKTRIYYICYLGEGEDYMSIDFNLKDKMYLVTNVVDDDIDSGVIFLTLHKAIHQKMKELGWL